MVCCKSCRKAYIDMKILQVIPSIADEASGPTYYMLRMGNALVAADVDIELHTLMPLPMSSANSIFPIKGYPRHDKLNLGISPEMKNGLFKASRRAEIIHNNSLWMMPNIYPYWAARGTTCKIVTSPHGTLSAWALSRGRWKKKVFGFLFQYPALQSTDMWHATSEKEYNEIRAAGYRQPVAIIPIGMDLPMVESHVKENDQRVRKVVFFGRIHKVKGVDRLLFAWEQVAKDGWELVIAGPDSGMVSSLKKIVAERKLPRVSFVGEILGHEKYEFLASCDIYVLPSDTENFGVTVAEALASGTPVIASQGTPWSGLESEKAGSWIPIGVEPLVEALKVLMSISDDERRAMGARGRDWIARDFSWNCIGVKMKGAYEWLLGKGDRPEFLRIE